MSQTRSNPDHGSPPRTPRWVKVFGILFIALFLGFVTLHLTGHGFGGDHMAMIQNWWQQLWR